ncbi:hypothetical protein [Cellulomonas chengniuliangii]|uniref:Ig-like domain-containing protein n=1 Tax=Cellulomonas chengniuliangii TaxID=2968084 RepID=A0ABY5L4L1_9CELL|nr:hypothetical protein [Cellulomonas chengniuliangii]MCC2308352.1 hypothetical protein [Cellulomonas chengniuliangii]UUI76734.1 hypothetical protein NP064_07590 [Cellulomonas chengniuliangii]
MSFPAPVRPARAQRTAVQPAGRARLRLVLALVIGMLIPLVGSVPAVAAGPPVVMSISRVAGAPDIVGANAELTYVVTFDAAVTGVDAGDFRLYAIGSVSGYIASVSGAGNTWDVTVNRLTGHGMLRLDLVEGGTGIVKTDGGEAIGGPIQDGFTSGELYTVDAMVPAAPVLTSAATTTSSRPTITGTAESGATITLIVGGATYATSASGDRAWTVDLAVAHPKAGTLALNTPGSNPVVVMATDAAGNVSPSAGQTLVIGAPFPAVNSVSVPADGLYGIGAVLEFQVNTQEAVQVDTTGGTPSLALVVGATTARADYTSGSGGTTLTFAVTVQAGWQDAGGISVRALTTNGGTLRTAVGADLVTALNAVGSTAGILVDGVRPAPPVAALVRDTGASATDGVTSDGRVQVSGLEQGGAWEWSADGGATWSGGTADQLVLPEGAHAAGAVRIRQTDAAGNTSPDWVSGGVLLIDLTAPTPPTLDPTPVRADAGPDADVGVLTATDATGQLAFILVAGAGDTDNGRFAVQGGRLVLRDPAAAGAGPRTVRVAAVDQAGNRTEAVLAVTVARTPPVQAVTVQPSDRLAVVPGATATFAVEVADPSTVASVRWQVTSSTAKPGATASWRDVPGSDGLALSVPVTVGGDSWYRAVVTWTDGAHTPSEPARLSVWDVRVQAGVDHRELAERFPGATDLFGAVPGLDRSQLPGTVTLTLPWTAGDSAVTAFVYSDPTYLGTFAVAAGRVTLTGVALDAGEHYIVLVGVDSGAMSVLRYDTAHAAPGRGGAVEAPRADRLAQTGADPVAAATGALLLVLTGALLLRTGTRRRRGARRTRTS